MGKGGEGFKDWFNGMPVNSRYLLAACMITTVGGNFGMLPLLVADVLLPLV